LRLGETVSGRVVVPSPRDGSEQQAAQAVRPLLLWCWVDARERSRQLPPRDAQAWKHDLFALMDHLGLEPDDLMSPCDDPELPSAL